MDVLERIEEIRNSENLTRDEFAERTKIRYTRWTNIFSGRAKIRHEEIEAVAATFPEYGYWLAYNKELPEAGQISPMTKKAMTDYRDAGKDA